MKTTDEHLQDIIYSSLFPSEKKTQNIKWQIYRVWEHVGVLPIWMEVCHVEGREKPIIPLFRLNRVILKTVIQCPLAAWCVRWEAVNVSVIGQAVYFGKSPLKKYPPTYSERVCVCACVCACVTQRTLQPAKNQQTNRRKDGEADRAAVFFVCVWLAAFGKGWIKWELPMTSRARAADSLVKCPFGLCIYRPGARARVWARRESRRGWGDH